MGKKKEAARAAAELAAREAAIVAELAAREAAKKVKKKAKKKAAKAPAAVELTETEKAVIADAKAERAKAKSAKTSTSEAAAKVLLDVGASNGAREAAETAAAAADEADHDETDEQIKARIKAKREARAAERAKETAPLGGVTSTVEALDAIAEPTPANIEAVEKAKAAVAAAREAVKAVAEVIETERGREFVVGAPGDGGEALEEAAVEAAIDRHNLAVPSDLPVKPDFEVNGNNQYRVRRPSDGKVVGYTRVTTYIANLEDRSMLEKWKLRMLLEGVAVNDAPNETGRDIDPVVAEVRDLIHRRDVAILKARKSDKKGKLVTGQLATIVDGAWSEFKRDLNVLAERLLDLGGANEKSIKGTDLHALCELHDREGIDAVGELLTEGRITPADFDDVNAYAAAMQRAGIKVIDIERPVVNHELKVAGRLDRTALVRFPGMARAVKVVVDIKTGGIELGAGKLAQQLDMYANARGYDLETHEEEDLKLSRTKAVVVHLPAGTGTCSIYPVDLVLGRKGNKLSGEVRAWRNEGKRAVYFKTALAAPVAAFAVV